MQLQGEGLWDTVAVMSMSARDPDAEELFRYHLVAQVRAAIAGGLSRSQAIQHVASQVHFTLRGQHRQTSPRTLYRWLAAFERHRLEGLRVRPRARTDSSVVLPDRLLSYLTDQKTKDPAASIPEILRRAREHGILSPTDPVDRSTAYRAARRMGLEVVRRRPHPMDDDMRRFAFAHRMEMVLADGNHFRAGITRARRVALFFLDDASRYGLDVDVGTSETTRLFLTALYDVVRRHGLMGILYLDRGPGFIALDTYEVMRRLERILIHGKARYPQGHGKVERFNRTVKPVLRALDGRPDVDPDPGALTLRLRHYLFEVYNHQPHESLGGQTPHQRFHADPAPLRMPDTDQNLRSRFVTFFTRCVSDDRCVPIEGTVYEVPRGHRGEKIQIHYHLLEGTYSVLHQGKLVQIHPVDLVLNARDRRAHRRPQEPATPPEKTAAQLAFERDFRPVVGPDGGCPQPTTEEDDS